MKIANLLKKDNIFFLDSVKNKWELIDLMLSRITESYPDVFNDKQLQQSVSDAVLEREKKSTTGIGDEIAFPHGRVDGLNTPIIAMTVLRNGVDFSSPDSKAVKIIFLFLFPGNRYELGVKIQAVFARFLTKKGCLNEILKSDTPETLHSLIENAELDIDTPIIAQDLMRNVRIKLTEDMTLQDVTHLMNEFSTETAAVIDSSENLIGEIDVIHLLQLEIPDYLKELSSVPPIKDFDPFNKYFNQGAKTKVGDVYNKNIAKLEPDASLFEVIFLLSVKKHSVVHVCHDNKLIGVIDRITVLDKVFNL